MGRLVGGRSAKGFRMPWITGVFLEIIHISAPDIWGNVLRDDSVALLWLGRLAIVLEHILGIPVTCF